MRVYKTILLASAAALISAGASADDRQVLKVSNTLDQIYLEETMDTIRVEVIEEVQNKVELNQINKGDISAHTSVWANNVTDYEATAVSIANNASFELKENFGGDFQQGSWGNSYAELNADVQNAMGVTNLTAVALGNNLGINLDNGSMVGSIGQTNDGDVTAKLRATVTGQVNDVTTTAVAIANNTAITFQEHASFIGGVDQRNFGNVSAHNSTTIRPMRRVIDPATSVAIGNNFSITNKLPQVQ